MTEYTPSEEDVRADYAIGGARDTIGDIDYSAIPELGAEFDRFLARVKRDAAREALDGLAEAMQDTPGIGPSTKSHRARMRTDIRIYRSRNYPETED